MLPASCGEQWTGSENSRIGRLSQTRGRKNWGVPGGGRRKRTFQGGAIPPSVNVGTEYELGDGPIIDPKPAAAGKKRMLFRRKSLLPPTRREEVARDSGRDSLRAGFPEWDIPGRYLRQRFAVPTKGSYCKHDPRNNTRNAKSSKQRLSRAGNGHAEDGWQFTPSGEGSDPDRQRWFPDKKPASGCRIERVPGRTISRWG